MTYEELKQQTIDRLLELGFIQDENRLIKTEIRQHQIIINGQPSIQEEKQTITFTIIGEGSIDVDPIIGLNLKVNRQDAGDFWLSSVLDLNHYLNINS